MKQPHCMSASIMNTSKVILFVVILPNIYPVEGVAVAAGQYLMTSRSDCIAAGFLDVPRNQTTYVRGNSLYVSESDETLSCRLQFTPQTDGDTLTVTLLRRSYISDCSVLLELQMTNADKVLLGCNSDFKSSLKLEAINGQLSLWMNRRHYDDKNYNFQVSVTAQRTPPCSASTRYGGMISGIYVGVIILLDMSLSCSF